MDRTDLEKIFANLIKECCKETTETFLFSFPSDDVPQYVIAILTSGAPFYIKDSSPHSRMKLLYRIIPKEEGVEKYQKQIDLFWHILETVARKNPGA
jgi:hypothetical protein